MIILLDTDVLLDFALERPPHADAAAELLAAVQARRFEAFVAWHSLANFHYLAAPRRGGGAARQFLAELLGFVDVAPASAASARYANGLPMPDFEDALQAATAVACGARHIATRNLRGFQRSPVPALSPAALLALP